MKYKVINKAFQPIRLSDRIIPSFEKRPNNVIFVNELSLQIKNLEKKGIIKIQKVK